MLRGVGERLLQFTLSSVHDVGNGSGGNVGVGVNVLDGGVQQQHGNLTTQRLEGFW
jgi:hypothetical protein